MSSDKISFSGGTVRNVPLLRTKKDDFFEKKVLETFLKKNEAWKHKSVKSYGIWAT